ncbi:MAG: CPBP family intramembrane metalloprotease, partial [Deltaproteobacteria bacterium]|nr:CPBP family intramembrane metalloprotease [Deltaproteobacteria bacterium]
AWILASTCIAVPLLGVLAAGLMYARGADLPTSGTPDLMELLGAGSLAGLTALQFAVMLIPAVILAFFLPGPTPSPPAEPVAKRSVFRRLADAFPLGGSRWGYVAAAIVLGATAGALPSWAVERLSELTGWEMSIANVITGIADAPLIARLGMYAIVGLVAPVVEELIFRGFLWAAIERSAPPWVAWLVTSLLFGAYHLDPMHVLAVLPLGLVLGWLRWRTGALWAPILFHLVNNALALVLTLWAPDLFTWIGSAVISAGVAAVVLAAGWALERSPVARASATVTG